LLNGMGRHSNWFHTLDPILTQVSFLRQ
jgi:hypothetical protein